MKILKPALIITGVGLVIFILYPWYKDAREMRNQRALTPVLIDGEKAKVIIDNKKVTIVDKDSTSIRHGVRDLSITVEDDGTVNVYAPQQGFIFEPGLAAYVSDHFYFGLDAQWAYWKQWGVYSGVGMHTHSRQIRVNLNLIGVGYTFENKMFNNTTIFAAYNTNQKVGIGVRVRF